MEGKRTVKRVNAKASTDYVGEPRVASCHSLDHRLLATFLFHDLSNASYTLFPITTILSALARVGVDCVVFL